MINNYYREIYDGLGKNKESYRYIIYKPEDQTGWGNIIRGLNAVFSLALALRRILIVEDMYILTFFNPPEGISWHFTDFLTEEDLTDNTKKINLYLRPDNWSNDEWNFWTNDNISDRYIEKIIIYNESTSICSAIHNNPNYSNVWKECFSECDSKMNRLGSITEFLLSNPKTEFLEAVLKYKKKMGIINVLDKEIIGIQFRSFFDAKSCNMPFMEKFAEEAFKVVNDYIEKINKKRLHIFITADSIKAMKYFKRRFYNYNVHLGLNRVIHISESPYPILNKTIIFLKKNLNKLFKKIFQVIIFKSFNTRLTEKYIFKHYRFPIIEWFILSECDAIISTFTSYSIYAAARRNNKQYLYKIDYKDNCVGVLNEERYIV
jgi:hypothetical protein